MDYKLFIFGLIHIAVVFSAPANDFLDPMVWSELGAAKTIDDEVWSAPDMIDYETCKKTLGEMDFTPTNVEDEVDDVKSLIREGHHSVRSDKTILWPNDTVPTIIEPGMTLNEQKRLACALVFFHERTCLTFTPRNDEKNYLYITKSREGCFSEELGMKGGEHIVNLDLRKPHCWKHGTIVHELMHALGFFHEQARNDRYQYVAVHWEAIPSTWHDQFKTGKQIGVDQNLLGGYDFESVMHYPRYIWSPMDAIMSSKVQPQTVNNVAMGNRDAPTHMDMLKINLLYQCPGFENNSTTTEPESTTSESSTTHPQGDCVNGQYVRKDYPFLTFKCTIRPPNQYCSCNSKYYGQNCDHELPAEMMEVMQMERTIDLSLIDIGVSVPYYGQSMLATKNYLYFNNYRALTRMPKNVTTATDADAVVFKLDSFEMGNTDGNMYRFEEAPGDKLTMTFEKDGIQTFVAGDEMSLDQADTFVNFTAGDLKRWHASEGGSRCFLLPDGQTAIVTVPFKSGVWTVDVPTSNVIAKRHYANRCSDLKIQHYYFTAAVNLDGDLLVVANHDPARIYFINVADFTSVGIAEIDDGVPHGSIQVDNYGHAVVFVREKESHLGHFLVYERSGAIRSKTDLIPRPERWTLDRHDGKIFALTSELFEEVKVYKYIG